MISMSVDDYIAYLDSTPTMYSDQVPDAVAEALYDRIRAVDPHVFVPAATVWDNLAVNGEFPELAEYATGYVGTDDLKEAHDDAVSRGYAVACGDGTEYVIVSFGLDWLD